MTFGANELLLRHPYVVEFELVLLDALAAVVAGPAHAIAQRWLAGQISGSLITYADDLIDAAVGGLSDSPTPRRRRTRRLPAAGHIRLQLLADDGTVIAEGHGVAELKAADST